MEKNVTSHGFEEAFRIALTTWASWMEKNIDPMKTQVFFRSFASIHFRYTSHVTPPLTFSTMYFDV